MEKKSISEVYFGYLVGQVREVLEASISDERQLKALTGVVLDRMYKWWESGSHEPTTTIKPQIK